LLVARVADRLRAARERGGKILVVAGPAVVHTGGGPELARMVEAGWVGVLLAGNGFATHAIESNVLGTSLAVSVEEGTPTSGGLATRQRAVSLVRPPGRRSAAVEAGYITGGVMRALVGKGVRFVLAGLMRDVGALPDVLTDSGAAADAMRELLAGLQVALML